MWLWKREWPGGWKQVRVDVGSSIKVRAGRRVVRATEHLSILIQIRIIRIYAVFRGGCGKISLLLRRADAEHRTPNYLIRIIDTRWKKRKISGKRICLYPSIPRIEQLNGQETNLVLSIMVHASVRGKRWEMLSARRRRRGGPSVSRLDRRIVSSPITIYHPNEYTHTSSPPTQTYPLLSPFFSRFEHFRTIFFTFKFMASKNRNAPSIEQVL